MLSSLDNLTRDQRLRVLADTANTILPVPFSSEYKAYDSASVQKLIEEIKESSDIHGTSTNDSNAYILNWIWRNLLKDSYLASDIPGIKDRLGKKGLLSPKDSEISIVEVERLLERGIRERHIIDAVNNADSIVHLDKEHGIPDLSGGHFTLYYRHKANVDSTYGILVVATRYGRKVNIWDSFRVYREDVAESEINAFQVLSRIIDIYGMEFITHPTDMKSKFILYTEIYVSDPSQLDFSVENPKKHSFRISPVVWKKSPFTMVVVMCYCIDETLYKHEMRRRGAF